MASNGYQKMRYLELSKAKVQETRNLVISQAIKDGKDAGFSIAQQLEVQEGNKTTSVFLKGSTIVVDDINALTSIRNALNVAIDRYHSEQGDDIEWDEDAEPEDEDAEEF